MSSTKNKSKKTSRKLQNLIRHKEDVDEDEFKEDSDSGHGTASTTLTISHHTPVDMMTSKDFQFDVKAHIEMVHQHLKDKIRIQKYKEAILYNRHLFKDKIVLDVNCGIGIYSMFAVKAGAAKVYAIDPSNVIDYAQQIILANGYADVIELLKGKIEEIQLPVKEVDIIISDWVGYAMLFQSTCQDVIYARDKWLKKEGGLIFPDQAKLFMIAFEDRKHKNENIEWWKGVYGFNMQCLREVALKEPRYQLIKPQQILSKQCPIKLLDLNKATKDELKFRSKFMLPIEKAGHMDGLSLYFHIYFTKSHTPLGFSTDPWSAGTNWMQTLLFLDKSLSVKENTIYYGGIEMFSKKTPVDLSDMIVNVELLMGDPLMPDVDIEMSWDMRPATAPMEPMANSTNNVISKDIEEIQSKAELSSTNVRENFDYPTKFESNLVEPINQPESSLSTMKFPKRSETFALGNNIYICRKQRRNKKKHSKKG